MDQWARDCGRFGFVPVFCSSNHSEWRIEAKSILQDFNIGSIDNVCLLVVHDTASSEDFQNIGNLFKKDLTMLVADETHHLGSLKLRNALLPNFGLRLGLSATPRRWYDEEGTKTLNDYFNGVCFEFTLEQAIGKYLVPYEYHPIIVNLSPDEQDQYYELSKKIAILKRRSEMDSISEDRIKRLLLDRARIVASAKGKLTALLHYLEIEINNQQNTKDELGNVLIYCAAGTHKDILKEVSHLGLRCHEFVHYVSMDQRHVVLDRFAKKDIQVLVSIKCLDEGVDVPSTEKAFFLASTTNPREFIQRRGRILRKAPNKSKAVVFDFIVIPHSISSIEVGKSLLEREMPRFVEFSSSSLNEFEARSILRPILDEMEMLNLLDEKPWDVYHKLISEKSILIEET